MSALNVTSLGRYELREEIGQGAMAVVWRAFDPKLRRDIAIKVLRPEFASDPEQRAAFLTEAHAAAKLAHAGIVTVHDVGEAHDGTPFLAMELLAGATLQQVLDRRGSLPATEVVDIGLQLAEALEYAHRKGVVHRDVKPDNIVRMAEGLGVKLTDFGIARLRQPDSDAIESSASGGVVGTPNFMAPEQIRGAPIDGRADLYALGVVMYVLLSGQLPFERDTVRATLVAILDKDPPPLQPRDETAPAALCEIVATLMARNPGERYATGGDLAQDLRQVARELESREQTPIRIPLHVRWPLTMAATVALAMIVGGFAVHGQQRAAMTDVVVDYGSTLAENIATETAEDILLDDQAAVQARVEGMERNRHIDYLRVADRDGRVIASTRNGEVGESVAGPEGASDLLGDDAGVAAYRQADGEGDRFLFVAPVTYDQSRVGEIALAIPDRPLENALQTTLVALGALVLATLLTVLLAAHVLARRFSLPVRVLANALDQVRRGRLAYRIRLRRRDEFGALFHAYNRMAEALQRRFPESTGEPTAAGDPPPAERPPQERATVPEHSQVSNSGDAATAPQPLPARATQPEDPSARDDEQRDD